MNYPAQVRRNMRYRGPAESAKMNHQHTAVLADIYQLQVKAEEIKQKINYLTSMIRTGVSHNAVDGVLQERIATIHRDITRLKGGVTNA